MLFLNKKPSTPSIRGSIFLNNLFLWRGKSVKFLTKGVSSNSGRNNSGRITIHSRCRGSKKKYRIIDFKRDKFSISLVQRIEYDPNRSANIALVKSKCGIFSYIIAPEKLSIGSELSSHSNSGVFIGNCLPLKNIPMGVCIHNIELYPNKGAQLSRSAGCFAVIVGRSSSFAHIRLRSGEIRLINSLCNATIGSVSVSNNKNIKLGKAGRKLLLGFKPKVRGVAKNPVDHPHGGGEGKSSGGRHPVTKFGMPTKGYKTRRNVFTSIYIIKNRFNR